jgi:hypothetical protein
MIVYKNLGGDTTDGISAHLQLEDYTGLSNIDGSVLFYGINCTFDKQAQDIYKNYKRKVLLNLWSPCEFTVPDNPAGNGYAQVDYFDEIYTVCPYTSNWLNKLLDDKDELQRHKFIYHPFDASYIPTREKIYDCIYFGGLHGPVHYDCISKLKQFNYRFLSQQSYPEVTNYNVSYKEKMNIVAQSKISVCYHYIPLRDDHIRCIESYNQWKSNKAFSQIHTLKIIPQLKARMHEAAICKTLNLVHRDPWNVVENFYEPGVDFIYFNDNDELPGLITNILKNWDSYKPMIKRAFNKCLNYTACSTFDFIVQGKEYEMPKL